MNRNALTLVPLALALAAAPLIACNPDDNDQIEAPPEDDVAGRHVVRGEMDDDGPAIEGDGRFDSATEVHVVSVAPDGARETHGSSSIEADGSFEIEAEGMTRTFLIEARDAEGRLVAAAIAHVDDAEDEIVEAGTVSAESSVEAMVWAEVVAEVGFDLVTSAEVRSRVDASTSTAIHAWRDGTDALSAGFDVTADAVLAGAHARESAAAEHDVDLSAEAQGRVRSQVMGSRTGADFAVALDAALEAEGLSAEQRSEIASRSEGSLRAAFDAAISGGDAGAEAAADAASEASATTEARAHAVAWTALAAKAETSTELTVDLAASLEALADARESGTTSVTELQAEIDAMAWTAAEASLPAQIGPELAAELGVAAGVDRSVVVEAMVLWLHEVRSDLSADLRAAAEASASNGSVDGEAMASASASAWTDARDAIEQVTARLDDDTGAHVALSLVASSFVAVD